jgi:uncharacterized protein with ATP-grasp and redox domains
LWCPDPRFADHARKDQAIAVALHPTFTAPSPRLWPGLRSWSYFGGVGSVGDFPLGGEGGVGEKRTFLKPDLECAPCIWNWVYERAGLLISEERRFQLSRSVLGMLSQEFYTGANVGLISNKITAAIDEFIFNSAEYFEGFKLRSNQLAKELLSAARNFIEKGQTPQEKLVRACCVASVSNVAPMGVPSEVFKFQEVIHILEGKGPLPTVMGDVFKAAQKANRILYMADNAGEIGFDSLLIAKLKEMGSKVTLIVKEDPFFEDATMKDIFFFTMDQLVDNISTAKGFFVPSEPTPSLTDSFKNSDLLIAKGTGNYEALQGETKGKTTIFMLKVKCRPIATKIGATIGNFVVKLEK